MTELLDQVWGLLNRTLEVYRDSPQATEWLRRHAERFDGPLRVAVAGQPKSGKSTLVNALVGEQVAPVELADDVQPTVWYRAGATPRSFVHLRGGAVEEVPAERVGGRLSLELEGFQDRPVDRVVVDWPARGLKGMTLIDCPAERPADMDAVLYVTQHLQAADFRVLRAMHDNPIAMANPVGVLLVLSRADEAGASQIDALFAAKQLARLHRRDLRTMALCQDVVAVTGLLGYAGRALRQEEFDALSTIAFAPRASMDQYLLSADRFAGTEFPVALDVSRRRALLDRLGLFGLRLCTALVRQGFDNHSALSAQLVQRSGMTELRESIGRYLIDRADALKARSLLLAIEVVPRAEPRPEGVALLAELERILAGAHDLRELRLLASLHAGHPVFSEELNAEARQLIGGDGVSLPARLGLAEEPTPTGLRYAIIDALRRWREQAENPILDVSARSAAATVVRSCEGMLASLSAGG
jgi:hypothetical protein